MSKQLLLLWSLAIFPFITLLQPSNAGRIESWAEPLVLHPNRNFLSTITLYFSLDSGLQSGNYMRIRLPFRFPIVNTTDSITWDLVPSGVRGLDPPILSKQAVIKYVQNISPYDIFILFSDDLQSNARYAINIPVRYQPNESGFLGFILLETLSPADSLLSSSASDVPITYDLNTAFASIQIFEAPVTPQFFGLSGIDAFKGVTSRLWNATMSLTPRNNIWPSPIILISWDNPAASISACINIDSGANSTLVTPFRANEYNCTISKQSVTIIQEAPLLSNQTVSYQLTIQNPSVAGMVNFDIKIFHRFNYNITDYQQRAVTLPIASTNDTDQLGGYFGWNNMKVLLSWGIDRLTLTNDVMKSIFQLYSTPATAKVFQAIRFTFVSNSTLPSSSYDIKIIIGDSTLFNVLENSIVAIMSNRTETSKCSVSTGSKIYIICRGITSLSSVQENSISAKVWISSAITSDIIPAPFGTIELLNGTTPVILGTRAIDSYFTQKENVPELAMNLNGNGAVIGNSNSSSSWIAAKTGTAFPTAADTNFFYFGGIHSNSKGGLSNLGLITSITANGGFFEATPSVTFNKNNGLDIFLNPNVWASPSNPTPLTSCYVTNEPAGTNAEHDNLHCSAAGFKPNNLASSLFTRLRTVFSSNPTTANLNTNSGASKYMMFLWEGSLNMTKTNGDTMKADSKVNDFYIATYKITSPSTIYPSSSPQFADLSELSSPMLENNQIKSVAFTTQYILYPVTIDSGQTSGLFQSFTAFVSSTSQSADLADTSRSVQLLTIRGYFGQNETFTKNLKLTLFFVSSYSYLTPALSESASTGVGSKISCSSANSTASSCRLVRGSHTTPFLTLDSAQMISTEFAVPFTATSTANAVRFYLFRPPAESNTGKFGVSFYDSDEGVYYIPATVGNNVQSAALSTNPDFHPSLGSSSICSYENTPISGPFLSLIPNISKVNTASAAVLRVVTTTAWTNGDHGVILYCSVHNFLSDNLRFATIYENNNDKCFTFDYSSTSDSQSFYCFGCPLGAAPPTIADENHNIKLTNFKAFSNTDIQVPFWAAVTNGDGQISEYATCKYTNSIFLPGNATAKTTGTVLGYNYQKISLNAALPSGLTNLDTIKIIGYNVATGTLDQNFPYLSASDANSICRLFSGTKITRATRSYTCSLSITPLTGSIIISFASTSLSPEDKSQTDWTIAVWGLSGRAISSSNPLTNQFVLSTYRTVSGLQGLVDQTPAGTGKLVWPLTNLTSSEFAITNIKYRRNFLGGSGSFQWDFATQNSRPFFMNDIIIFDLSAIITASSNNNFTAISCLVTDQNDVVMQKFKECTIDNSGSTPSLRLKLLPQEFEIETEGLRLYLWNIDTIQTTVNTIYGRLYYSDTSKVVLSKENNGEGIEISTNSPSFPSSLRHVVTKYWNNPGVSQTIEFQLMGSSVVDEFSQITIVFPSYYSNQLGFRAGAMSCSLDGEPTYCFIEDERTVVVTGNLKLKPANSLFVVKVIGVIAPSQYTSPEAFRIAITERAPQDSSATLVNCGSFADESFIALPNVKSLDVVSKLISPPYSRNYVTVNWVLQLPFGEDHVSNSKLVQIIFPPTWGILLDHTFPSCFIYDSSDVARAPLSGTQTNEGRSITLPLASDLISTGFYSLECTNIRNIDDLYLNQEAQFRIVDPGKSSVLYQSTPAVHNINYNLSNAYGKVSLPLFWLAPSSVSNPIVITRGVYSALLTVYSEKAMTNIIELTPSSSRITTQPSRVIINSGVTTNSFYLGAPSTAQIGLTNVVFTSSNQNSYSDPPVLWVLIDIKPVVIYPSPIGDLSIAAGCFSRRIIFDLSSSLPYSDLVISPVIQPSDGTFTVTPASITLTTSNPVGFFVLKASSGISEGVKGTLSYSLGGTNANSYTLNTGHNFTVATQSTEEPINVVILKALESEVSVTSIRLLFDLSGAEATISFLVTNNFVADFSMADIDNYVKSGVSYNKWDPNQLQCGSFVASPGVPNNIRISNLKSSTNYRVVAYAMTPCGTISPITTFNFTTPSNGGKVSRIVFQFRGNYPTPSARQALLCGIVQVFAIPSDKIIDIHGEICGNRSSFYSLTNSSMGLPLFFYPLDINGDDDFSPNIISLLNHSKDLINSTLGLISSQWTAFYEDGVINPVAPEVNFSASIIQSAANSLVVRNISFANDGVGYLWVILDKVMDLPPTIANVRSGVNSELVPFLQSNVIYLANKEIVSVTFKGLQSSTSYDIYLVTSNSDPSIFANYSTIRKYSGRTLQVITHGLTLTVIHAVFIAFILAIIL